MHAELILATEDHTAATDGWQALLSETTPEQANWRPAPDRWSSAQCLDHVRIVTEAALPALESAVVEARAVGLAGAGPFRYGWLGRQFLAGQAPGGGRRMRTLGSYRPSASAIDLAAASERFASVQSRLAAVIAAADGLDLARVRVPSPALPPLRFPIGIWLRAMPQHTLRHLEQAKRVEADRRSTA